MKILALDLGTTMGWAFAHDGIVTSGVVNFKNKRFEGGGMRFLRFERWLIDLLKNAGGQIDAIYFEEVRRHLGTTAAHLYGGFMAGLQAFCEKNNIPYQGVPVGTIKKHASGKGNATKELMIACAHEKGWNVSDSNEADARHLLDFAIQEYWS